MTGLMWLGIILAIVFIIFLVKTVHMVSQAEEYVVERWGRYHDTWEAGIHFLMPWDRVARKVSKRELTLDVAPQPVITKDNVTISVDSFIFYTITNSKAFTYGVENAKSAMNTLATSTLRNIIGNLDLEGCLTSRDEINRRITGELDMATNKWGIKVIRVEIENITPPRDIQNAMDRQMKADRERRETIILAEAEKSSKLLKAQTEKEATILKAQADKEAAELNAEAAKIVVIKGAEAESESALLRADAAKLAAVKEAEGQAIAIRLLEEARAEANQILNEKAPCEAVLRLKAYDALVETAKGQATKLIIPSDLQGLVGIASVLKETLAPSAKKIL
ncbi:MAG: SPFH/Band 7/PHB domain protein [Proteobacteria bacterium]|nr:SPFH/Band 7/PHB domain protein [Pseudomonadota bacterium]